MVPASVDSTADLLEKTLQITVQWFQLQLIQQRNALAIALF